MDDGWSLFALLLLFLYSSHYIQGAIFMMDDGRKDVHDLRCFLLLFRFATCRATSSRRKDGLEIDGCNLMDGMIDDGND